MSVYFAGIDIGSTMTKVVILKDDIITSIIGPTGPEYRRLANKVMEEALRKANLSLDEITYIVATGYGRINVPFSDKQVTEITCHAKGIHHLFPRARTIIDIGGQDVKGIKIDSKGKVTDFVMNDKCAAGTGRFIEVIADTLGIKINDVGKLSLQSKNPSSISNFCTVWAQQEVIASIAEGITIPDILAGVHRALADRIVRLISRLNVEDEVVLTGGGGKNEGLIYAIKELLGRELRIPEEPLITGALGAALMGEEIVNRARENNIQLEIKKRVLEKVEI